MMMLIGSGNSVDCFFIRRLIPRLKNCSPRKKFSEQAYFSIQNNVLACSWEMPFDVEIYDSGMSGRFFHRHGFSPSTVEKQFMKNAAQMDSGHRRGTC